MAAMLAAAVPMTTNRAGAQAENADATPERAASMPVAAPAQGGNFLDIYVRAYTPPDRGAVEAVVTLGPAGSEIEIGRFAVFPSAPFLATTAEQQRAYRFEATAALKAAEGKPLLAQVRLLPTDPKISAAGARLSLGKAEIVPRP